MRGRTATNCATLLALALAGAGSARAQGAEAAAPTPMPTPMERIRVRQVMPEGWLGINYVCEIKTEARKGEVFITHYGYPLIASVEPGSPADRAGLEAGDTILAYNGEDLKNHTLSLTRLLKPDSRLLVRVRRARETYDLPVTVGRRTAYAPNVRVLAPGVVFEGGEQMYPGAHAGRAGSSVVITRVPPGQPTPPAAVVAVAPPAPMAIMWSGATTALAGAEMARVGPELGEVFGVERGVLILSVGPNTPAARAGLRGGDVILTVNGEQVAAPNQVQTLLQRYAEEQQLKLIVVRKRKTLPVVLKW